jgi:hypothetical protein
MLMGNRGVPAGQILRHAPGGGTAVDATPGRASTEEAMKDMGKMARVKLEDAREKLEDAREKLGDAGEEMKEAAMKVVDKVTGRAAERRKKKAKMAAAIGVAATAVAAAGVAVARKKKAKGKK